MTNATDPRVIAGAKAWDKHMGGRYAPDEVEELAEEVAVILAAADAIDPLRKHHTITTVEELDALPVGSLLRDREGKLWHIYINEEGDRIHQGADFGQFPATVLVNPETETAG